MVDVAIDGDVLRSSHRVTHEWAEEVKGFFSGAGECDGGGLRLVALDDASIGVDLEC